MRTAKTDQTGWMPRMICVIAGCTLTLLVLSCRGSIIPRGYAGGYVPDTWFLATKEVNFERKTVKINFPIGQHSSSHDKHSKYDMRARFHPGDPSSLSRVFAGRMRKVCVLSCQKKKKKNTCSEYSDQIGWMARPF